MRIRHWLAGITVTASTMVLVGGGCGGSSTSDTTDAGQDVAADRTKDNAVIDAAPDNATMCVDADLATLNPADAAINDAGASVGTCLACTKANCMSQLSACNADCDCKNAVAGFFDCVRMPGGSLTGCAGGLGANATAQGLGLCVYTGCKTQCGVPGRPVDGGSDADAD